MKQWLAKNYKVYLLIGYTFLLLIHFVIKDNFFPLSIVFYVFPLLILIGIAAFLALLFFRIKKYRTVLLIVFISLSVNWIQNYYFSTEINTSESTSKIFYWNIAKKNRLPIGNILKHVQRHQPDILAFVEATRATLSNLDSLKVELPNYNFIKLKGAMLVASKKKMRFLDFKVKTDAYKVNLLEIKTNTSSFKFIVTDLTAYLHVDKKELLNFVLNYAIENDVDGIIGDFNTPFESVHFNDFNTNYNSFHSYNDGFTTTWPLALPLFEIDHIWLSKKYKPIKLYKAYNDDSDHALLISHFVLN